MLFRSLSEVDKSYLEFGQCLERSFITQDLTEDRSIEESLDIGWRALGCLPREELTRLSATMIETHKVLLDEGLRLELEIGLDPDQGLEKEKN